MVLSFEDARRVVEEHASRIQHPATEAVDLLDAAGRVLADHVLADRDFPPFPRSARDGYAVRAEDLSAVPARLEMIGEIKAGEHPDRIPSAVGKGQAVSIMTGAPVPNGADAVVMVENTVPSGAVVEISRAVQSGENVVPRSAEAARGSVVLDRSQRIGSAAIALAASVGKSQLQVYRRPTVAILATGDELVDVGVIPGPTQIRNSNSYSLSAQVRETGGIAVRLPIAPDNSKTLRNFIEQGLESDLLLISGGVSMGRYDLVEQVLSEMQAEFLFTGAKIQPGRPVVFGRYRTTDTARGNPTYFFGLPGNPVSTMVTFDLFVRPMLHALAGQSLQSLVFLHARLKSEINVKPGLKRFLPAILSGEFENSTVELIRWQGSGDLAATARSNCYVVVPPDREHIAAQEFVAVMSRQ